ncbi:hypothetical protein HMPREF1552_00525 [Leptotrichia sp. oral taxon 879 str. F0557]|nr:hypothetical protein HMPREF1552_00525 [Leptotrichia sp. oral taxon 879 str. F0557]
MEIYFYNFFRTGRRFYSPCFLSIFPLSFCNLWDIIKLMFLERSYTSE